LFLIHPTYKVARLGGILGLAWLIEYHPPFTHSAKFWDRDLYYFLCLLLLIYSLQVAEFIFAPSTDMTKIVPPTRQDARWLKSPEVLNREQTEEWKGWMQFMFLLYHYYKVSA
jgi:hypothetical protein